MPSSSTTSTQVVNVEQAGKVEAAVSSAIDLVRVFSERDPYDGSSENPWKNPTAMLEQLDRARDEIVAAWEMLPAHDESSGNDNSTTTAESKKDMDGNKSLQAAYMDMVTNAFSDVLDDMRSNAGKEEEIDVDILVDCLQSGLDFMSGEEKEIFMMDADNDDDDDAVLEASTSGPTPHEARRLQLGLHVC